MLSDDDNIYTDSFISVHSRQHTAILCNDIKQTHVTRFEYPFFYRFTD